MKKTLSGRVKQVFERGADAAGLNGLSASPQQCGLDEVTEYVADYTLSAIFAGLDIDTNSDEGRRILGAYITGRQKLKRTG